MGTQILYVKIALPGHLLERRSFTVRMSAHWAVTTTREVLWSLVSGDESRVTTVSDFLLITEIIGVNVKEYLMPD